MVDPLIRGKLLSKNSSPNRSEATQAVAEVASLIISPERSPPERVHTSQELHPIDYKTEGEILCETNLFTFEQTCSGF